MYCTHCGNKLTKDSKFCGQCGHATHVGLQNPELSHISTTNAFEGNQQYYSDHAVALTTSPINFIILNTITFGLYQYYWSAKNWEIIKQLNHLNLSPFWRGFFAHITNFYLFNDLQKYAVKSGFVTTYWMPFFAACALILNLAFNRFDGAEMDYFLYLLALGGLLVIISLCYLPAINASNHYILSKREELQSIEIKKNIPLIVVLISIIAIYITLTLIAY